MPQLRKRQARLAFNPLPTSSSPAGSPTDGARSYANVSYEGSPRSSKKRKVENLERTSAGATFIPTPERSSQVARITRQSTARATSKRARQGRIDFSNHIGVRLDESDRQRAASETSSVDSEEDAVKMRTKRKATTPLDGNIFGAQLRHVDESDGSDELAMPVESPSKRTKKRLTRSKEGGSAERKTRSQCRARPGHEEDEDPVVPRSTKRKAHIDLTFAESESSGDDVPILYSSPKMKRRPSAKATSARDDFIVSSDEEDDSEEDRTTAKKKSLPRWRDMGFDGDLSEEVSSVEEKPRKRRLKRRHDLTEQDREDLDEDLANLRSSPPTSRKKPNPRAEALEALKRRRAGTEAPSSSAVMRSDAVRILSSSEEEEEEAMLDANQRVENGTSPTQAALDEEEDVNDFVIEDDGDEDDDVADTLDLEMPLWATGFARMKPRELFRYAIEWMVHKKLNPAYPHKTADKYMLAFQKLNDEVQGLAGSKFTSSAWTRDFTISLQARPEMEVHDVSASLRGALDLDRCQACNRSGHPATFEMAFHGRPYDPHTLEPVEQDFDSGPDDEGDDEDGNDPDAPVEEREEYDHKGRLVPPAERAYAVGRFCKDNATTAHALAHWRFQLNEWVVDHLAGSGHLTDRKIVRRDRWDEPRRRKYAQAVVENMLATGHVKTLYQAFRAEIDSARERSGGRRGRGDAEEEWV